MGSVLNSTPVVIIRANRWDSFSCWSKIFYTKYILHRILQKDENCVKIWEKVFALETACETPSVNSWEKSWLNLLSQPRNALRSHPNILTS